MGVDRAPGPSWRRPRRVPHARGGGPRNHLLELARAACSPRAWGWTEDNWANNPKSGVFPTRVGVDRTHGQGLDRAVSVPHARGGGPSRALVTSPAARCSPRAWGWTEGEHRPPPLRMCSPRAWGWTGVQSPTGLVPVVFPTRVGVDRSLSRPQTAGGSVPHARGGGPSDGYAVPEGNQCSPRAWGWTGRRRTQTHLPGVFPTRVGVDRYTSSARTGKRSVPHARGGGPEYSLRATTLSQCSPRAWGWTERIAGTDGFAKCSPRAWGWTAERSQAVRGPGVFPTRVGVDRRRGGDL